MKIKLLTSLSGPSSNHIYGEEVEMEDAQAIRYIEGGMATPVRDAEGEDTSAKLDSVEFARLNKADIVAKAAEVHGLELDPTMKKAEMLAAIDEHLSKSE